LPRNSSLIEALIETWQDDNGCGVQRKVFRVEQMLQARRAAATAREIDAPNGQPFDELRALRSQRERRGGNGVPDNNELMRELALIHKAIMRDKHDLASLLGRPGEERRMARAVEELGATIGSLENATQKILMETEIIDESARALSASLKKEYELGLAQDIQDSVVRVYETCNFQDLTGQRIGKVMATLKFVEEHVASMIVRWGDIDRRKPESPATGLSERRLVNGPKLGSDTGHVSQHEIDAMFA
jgi:chemotaxis protein CheZ